MGIKIIEIRLCDYCEKEDPAKETEADDTITINGRTALACDRHGKPVRKILEAFEAVSVPDQALHDGHVPRGRRGRSAATPPTLGGHDKPKAADIRAWALGENDRLGEKKYVVTGNSRLRNAVVKAYKDAHGLS
ncbi:hypothetical protein [Nonomuraea longicatena]|uniref:Uncharacterized protein n=1 Tax=Nonomuraea longicatena TaxID=83682 RepID=A0ABP4BUY3_9ACTN